MANNLYEEAINAAEQLKEAAESKVKQHLIEAMSPQIKQLVEKSLLGEEVDELSVVPVNSGEKPKDDAEDDAEDKTKDKTKDDNKSKDPKNPGKEVLSDSESQEECGTAMEGDENWFFAESENAQVEISAESTKILKNMLGQKAKRDAVAERLKEIKSAIVSLKRSIVLAEGSNKFSKHKSKFVLAYKNILRELKNIKESNIIKSDKTLLKEYLRISKELNSMSTRRRSKRNYLNESLDDLLEMNIFEEDEDEEGTEGDEKTDTEPMEEPAEEGGDYDELMDMPLKDVLDAALGGEGGAGEDLDLDLDLEDKEEDEEEDEEEDVAEEGYHIELDEMDEEDGMKEARRQKGDLFLEIDENMLKNEITKMRRLREGEASEMASHFGGGELDKEMFIDVDEGDLNVHSGNLGREDVPMPKVEAALRKTMRKNRMLESKVLEYQDAVRGMKTQLTEMNLFNAKLLYANKLMQNRGLSLKQQRHIVESLDEASTLNEAKLLFESLSKSLTKPVNGKNLNESANRRTLGSSSRPVSSGSAKPMNESVALDRWATLAGIKK